MLREIIMSFLPLTPEQVIELQAPLDGANVKSRNKGGVTLGYIEGWHAIAEANRIFGFDGWSRQTIRCEPTHQPIERENSKSKMLWHAGYMAVVRITAGSVCRDGTGFGSGAQGILGDSIESAIKEAETDAMKRALMTFGNPFGLALYDKSREHVTNTDAINQYRSAQQQRVLFKRLGEGIDECQSAHEIDVFLENHARELRNIKQDWQSHWNDKVARRRQLLEQMAAA
ncbi:MAG: RAD52 family DNA repair protein [Pseudomonadota bacterium]